MVTQNSRTNYTRVAPNVRAVTRKYCKYYTQVTQMMHESYAQLTPGQHPLYIRVTCGLHPGYARVTSELELVHTRAMRRSCKGPQTASYTRVMPG